MAEKSGTITDVAGILVGHATNEEHHTGCTAILCPGGAVGAMELRGMAPGTRETDLLNPLSHQQEIQGILLTGGSAYGLAAASGVMRYLSEQGHGYPTQYGPVPLVPAAVIFDLYFNRTLGLPDEAMGYEAAKAATDGPVQQGCVGAGAGASAGKLAGMDRAMKTGLGSVSLTVGDLTVAALAVANPWGDIVDPKTGKLLAGLRMEDGSLISGTMDLLSQGAVSPNAPVSNTVLVTLATDASLTKIQAARVARMASSGFARAINPAHTTFDGDVIFVMATGKSSASSENLVGALGAEVVALSIAEAARQATGLDGIPAYSDLAEK